MNLTLSLDDKLVKRARKVAAARGISLNQMIREELEGLTGEAERERDFAALKQLLTERSGNSLGWEWKREELYDRPVLR